MYRQPYCNESQVLAVACIESPIEIGTAHTTTAIAVTAAANSNEKDK